MNIIDTHFEGLKIIEPKLWEDERGYFFESYQKLKFEKKGIAYDFVQDNEAFSTYGILRGLHYQLPPYAQTKLIRVIVGKVWDVVVDIRPNQPTFGDAFGIELSGENKTQLLVPPGFAHGYVVLSSKAIFAYKVDQFYHKESDAGILYNDPELEIDWKLPTKDIILSEKDKAQPTFSDHKTFK